MEIILFAVALLLIVAAGCGMVLIALPRHRLTSSIEALCLSFLLGAGFVSLASFALGFFIAGWGLRLAVAACCLALVAMGLRTRQWRLEWRFSPPAGKGEWALLCLSLSLIGLAALVSGLRAMGWDGLFNWEIKARIAFLNGGVIPLSFYSDPTRPWTHPEYPLLLPLAEAWMYGWMGRADQQLAQFFLLIFFAAALGLLYAGVSRFGDRRAQVWAPPAMLLLAQQIIFRGQGGVPSGYADFPLAVLYLAAVILLLEYFEKGDAGLLLPFGLLAGTLPWAKREGAILWACLMAMAMIRAIQRRDWRGLAPAVLPGLAISIGWRIFLTFAKPSSGEEFMQITPSALRNNLWRAPHIARAVAVELLDWRQWGPLWIAAILAALFLIAKSRREGAASGVLPATVFLPVAIYAGAYIFSNWDFLVHMENSFPRLLLQVSLAAAMMVAVSIPIGPIGPIGRRETSSH